MRIGIWKLNPFVGGTEVSLVELAKFLKGLGHELFVFSEPDPKLTGLINEFGLKTIPVNEFPLFMEQLDLVFVYDVLIPKSRWEWMKKVPYRVHVAGGFMGGAFAHTRDWITHVLAKSNEIAAWATQNLFRKIPIFVAQFPIDLEYWQPMQPRMDLKKAVGISEGDIVIGTIGRIGLWKGLERFIRFRNLLKDRNVSFFIMGDLQVADTQEVKILEQLKNQNKIFIKSFASPSKVWYSIIDIFMMQSIQEGVSRSLMEAMAMARPTIVLDVGGTHNLNPKFMFAPYCETEQMNTLNEMIDCSVFRKEAGRINRGKIEVYNQFCKNRLIEFFASI